ncbi:MAG: Mur ligase domain-containing protein, partial [Lutimaribacter sp.]
MTQHALRLSQLGLNAAGGADPVLAGLAVDSRQVRPGYLFAALPGTQAHGAGFVAAALDKGAVAILTDADGAALAGPAMQGRGVAVVVAENPRQTLAYAAALWFGAQPKTMVAVTGTNGKTSVATFTRQ